MIYSVDSFQFKAKISGSWKTFGIQSFNMTKQLDKPVALRAVLVGGRSITNTSITQPLQLLTQYFRNNCKPIQCSVTQKTKNRLWFRGFITMISPAMTSAPYASNNITISCVGYQLNLMMNFIRDHTIVTQNMIKSDKQIITRMKSGNLLDLLYFGRQGTIQDLVDMAGGQWSDRLDTLLIKIYDVLRRRYIARSTNKQLTKVTAQQLKILPDLSQYIKSPYKLNYKPDNHSINYNSFITDLYTTFVTGVTQGTIWQGLLKSVSGDKMLHMVPPSFSNDLSKQYKYTIKPYLPQASQPQLQLKSDDIYGININSSPGFNLSVPDYLYVNFMYCSQFEAGKNIPKNTGLYGVYPTPGNQTSNDPKRVKIIDSPAWLLRLVLLPVKSNQSQDRGTISVLTQPKQARSKDPVDYSKLPQLLNSYAKLMFFRLYSQDIGTNVSLAINSDEMLLKADKSLGSVVNIDLKFTQHSKITADYSKWFNLPKLYGMVYKVSYSYKSSAQPNQLSTFDVSLGIDNVVSDNSRLASIYKGTSDTAELYKKS